MKISIAQIKPIKADLSTNFKKHLACITAAISHHSDLIFFPELSLIGYEPTLAKDCIFEIESESLNVFQEISNQQNLIICVGLPTQFEENIRISMLIFRPKLERLLYSKQQLHADEYPFFIAGNDDVTFTCEDSIISPAICFESLQENDAEEAFLKKSTIYLASVAKSESGVNKAFGHYSGIAQKYNMSVLMANSVGYCDNFMSFGNSAIWNQKGELIANLNSTEEAILTYDTENQQFMKILI